MKLIFSSQLARISALYLFFLSLQRGKNELALDLTFQVPSIIRIIIPIFLIISIALAVTVLYKSESKNLHLKVSSVLKSSILFIFFNLLISLPLLLRYFSYEAPAKLIHKIFRVSYINPIFADLQTIKDGIICSSVKQVGDLINCNIENGYREWNYPSVLLNLDSLVRILSSNLIIFLLIILMTNIMIYQLTDKLDLKIKIISIFIFCSPAFILVFNRLNFDIFILMLLFFGYRLLAKPTTFIFGMTCIAFASLLKFYCIVIFIYLLFSRKLWRQRFLIFTMMALTTLAILPDLFNSNKAIGKDIKGSVGLSVITSRLSGDSIANFKFNALLIYILIFIILNSILIFKQCQKNKLFNSINLNEFLFFAFPFLISWILVSNYYYRLILLTPAIILLFKQSSTFLFKEIGILSIFSLYSSPNIVGTLQNFLLLPIICLTLVFLYHEFIYERFLV